MRTLIIIPTYNEIENIGQLIPAVFQELCPAARKPETWPKVDILVVDDGSPDGTGNLVQSLANQDSRIHLMRREKKLGLGTAYVAGFRWGFERGYEAFIEMDADFSHHPRYLPTMLSTLTTHDVAIGSRYVPGGGVVNWGIGRKILSRGGSLYSRLILGASIRDFTGGFNGWKKSVLEKIDLGSLRSDGYSFQIELKYRAFLLKSRIEEFPIVFEDRKVGKSKMNRRIVFEALGRVWGFRIQARNLTKSLGSF